MKSNIPIKYLCDEIVTNPSKGLVYMLENDIIIDTIITTEEEEEELSPFRKKYSPKRWVVS
ncbi:hypothetical protein BH23THE1_BH23THE1_02490 [soil metagenome]